MFLFEPIRTNIFSLISLFGAFLSFFIAIGISFTKDKKLFRKIMIFGFFNISILVGWDWYYQTDIVRKATNILHLHLPTVFILGPSLYYFSRSGIEKGYQIDNRFFLSILPGILVLIFVFIVYIFFPPRTIYDIEGFITHNRPATIYEYLFFIGFAYNLYFYGLLAYKYKYIWWRKNWYIKKYIIFYLIVSVLGIINGSIPFLSIFCHKMFYIHFSAVFLSSNVIILLVVYVSFPKFFLNIQLYVEAEKKQRDILKNINISQTMKEFLTLLKEEKIFREESISLENVASELDLTKHQLSYLINHKMGKNFNQIINEFRIEEAKRVLVKNFEKSILEIAYEVGFNSKSTFNSAFLKIVNMTPSAYRQKFLKSK